MRGREGLPWVEFPFNWTEQVVFSTVDKGSFINDVMQIWDITFTKMAILLKPLNMVSRKFPYLHYVTGILCQYLTTSGIWIMNMAKDIPLIMKQFCVTFKC